MVEPADLSRLRIRRDEPGHGSKPRRWFVPAVLVVLLGLISVAATMWRGKGGIEVRTTTAALRGGASGSAGGVTATGYVVARTKASVSSKVPGRLVFLGVEEGDRVERGVVLARLEAAEYEAAVLQAASEVAAAEAAVHEAEASLAQAARDRQRAEAMDSLIPVQQVEDARTAHTTATARLAAAKARLEAARQAHAGARANLENTLIRAPFSGTVLRKDAEVGEVVAPAVAGGGLTRGAVVTMADLSTLEVETDVNEAYIAQIRDDQPAEIVLDAYPMERFPGHVRQVVPTADRQKATVLVRVAIDSHDPRILPEMGARVTFLEDEGADPAVAQPPRVFVPSGAVRNDGGQDIVWLVVDGRAVRRAIEAGPVMAGEREVRSGLAGGERLIVDPPDDLSEGDRVKIPENTDR